jgi:hypothetical protein
MAAKLAPRKSLDFQKTFRAIPKGLGERAQIRLLSTRCASRRIWLLPMVPRGVKLPEGREVVAKRDDHQTQEAAV